MEIKKVLLVSPNQLKNPYPVYPIALSYLKQSLKAFRPEIEVQIFDFNVREKSELKALLQTTQPDLVGISLRNIDTVNYLDERHFVDDCIELVKLVKTTINSVTVLGGAGFSVFPETIVKEAQPDFGVFGEGEESLVRLIEALESGNDPSNIEGLVYRVNDKIIANKRQNYCKNPALQYDEALIDYYWEKAGMINLQTKRGCAYHCAYCTYPLIEGNKIRTGSPQQIVSFIKELRNKKGINYFFFTDSIFNIKNDFNRELAERIIAEKVKIRWGAYFSPHNLTSELLELLKKSGLTHIEFGTESLSNSTLKAYNKNFLVEDVIETATICKKLRLFTAHFLIIGGIGETNESIEETIQNSELIEKALFFPFFGMRIYPNTAVHRQSIAEGVIKEEETLIKPRYYLLQGLDTEEMKKKTELCKNRWIYPDEDHQQAMEEVRKRQIRGPLWEYLIK